MATAGRLLLLLLPSYLAADCLPQADMQLYAQQAWIHRTPSRWEIGQKKPYRKDSAISEWAIRYDNRCELLANALSAEFSLVGLAYYPWQTPGVFETDSGRSQVIFHRLSLSYPLSATRRVTAGKFSPPSGLFYIKSPAELLHNSSAEFKAGRIYASSLQEIYTESLWGVKLAEDTLNYGWSVTVAPRLTRINRRYVSSANWSTLERSNADERYLFTYSDYRWPDHQPSVSLRLGESRSLAVADSFQPASPWTLNAELAWHAKQQWRHFAEQRAKEVQRYAFPSALFQRGRQNGMELALSGQYTTRRFSQFGAEYYFQREGYSRQQWHRQAAFIRYLHQRTGFAPLDTARDAYKYLMAAEIDNIARQGKLQGKHYLNLYATLAMANDASLRVWRIVNLQDKSAMLALHINQPLTQAGIDIYGGAYRNQGGSNTEFGLFGKTAGIYAGMKYYF